MNSLILCLDSAIKLKTKRELEREFEEETLESSSSDNETISEPPTDLVRLKNNRIFLNSKSLPRSINFQELIDLTNGLVVFEHEIGHETPVQIETDWSDIRSIMTIQPEGWSVLFRQSKQDLTEITNRLHTYIEDKRRIESDEYRVYPPFEKVFSAFEKCSLDQVRVVIIGQDPYPQPDMAVGMSFSIPREMKLTKSLMNIYKELANSVPGFNVPKHGDLTRWAEQGVLLLNICLTVDRGVANSHQGRWLPFIRKALKNINDTNDGVIFVLWGREAQKIEEYIDNNAIILKGYHPVARGKYSFVGCGHFVEINNILAKRGQEIIDWNLD